MEATSTPVDRPSARILLIDGLDRILLFASAIPDGVSPGRLWVAPGGAVEAGETWEEAARRELREETGIDVPLGPWVWRREHVWYWASRGHWVRSLERYFVARTATREIDRRGWTEAERAGWIDWRWWTVAELATTGDVLVPRQIASLLPALLAGELPATPIDVGT